MNVLRIAAAAMFYAVASGTTLVAVWSPERLLLGADSMVTTMTAQGVPIPGSACKIAREGEAYFAFSGFVEDVTTRYRADTLAHQAFAAGGTLEQRLNRFVELAREPLLRSLVEVRKDSPEHYAALIAGRPALQAIFGVVERGPASLGVVGFNVSPNGTLIAQARVIAEGDDGRGPRIITAGQQGRIREYLRDHRDWHAGEHSQLVRTLIESEIAGGSGQVGGAIDILQLTPNAASWVQRKAECGPGEQ